MLLENLLRHEGSGTVSADDVEALAGWDRRRPSRAARSRSRPRACSCRTSPGVPAIVDLAAMRDAIAQMGGDPAKINPLVPVELVIDHSVQVDAFGTRRRLPRQRRARVRAQPRALRVPALGARTPSATSRSCRPDTGICHQVNLEYLARVVFADEASGQRLPRHAGRHGLAHDDGQRPRRARLGRRRDRGRGGDARPAGVDAHPAGARRQAARASCARARPRPISCSRSPRCCASAASSGKFVEFFGDGPRGAADRRPRDDRQHVAGVRRARARSSPSTPRRFATCEFTGRPRERIELVEAYCREQGLWHDARRARPALLRRCSSSTSARSCRASPGRERPQDRVALSDARTAFEEALADFVPDDDGIRDAYDEAVAESYPASDPPANGVDGEGYAPRCAERDEPRRRGAAPVHARAGALGDGASVTLDGESFELRNGDVVIAAITSCTNTSNPSVMVGAGLLARNAVAARPAAQAVGEDLARARARVS